MVPFPGFFRGSVVVKEVCRTYVGIFNNNCFWNTTKELISSFRCATDKWGQVWDTLTNAITLWQLLLFHPFFFDSQTLTLNFLSIFRCSCCRGKTKTTHILLLSSILHFSSFLIVNFTVVSRLEIPTLCRQWGQFSRHSVSTSQPSTRGSV